MNDRSYKPLRPGQQISAREMNRALDKLSSSSDIGGDINVSDEFGQQLVTPTEPPRTNIRILSGAGPYAWEEVRQKEDNTWYATGVRSGTVTDRPAYERNGMATVAAGSVYEAAFDPGPNGAGRWLFNAGTSPLTYVRITSATPTSGRYPAVLATYDANASAWTDVSGPAVWVVDPNGNNLGLKHGEAKYLSLVSGVAVYMGSADLWDDGAC